MIKAIKALLKRNKSVMYWVSCFKRRKEPLYFDSIVNPQNAKELFFIHSNGNKYKDNMIYNIDIHEKSGLFCMYRHILHALYIADRFGFLPYIRINRTYYNNTLEKEDNVFDYYFVQPSGLNWRDVNEAYNVVEYRFGHIRWIEEECGTSPMFAGGYDINDNLLYALARVAKKYIVLKPNIKEKLEQDIETLLSDDSVIAIHYRGNAYKVGYYGHPIGLSVEDYYPYIDECISNGYKKFFLATDEKAALEQFVSRYKGCFIYYTDTIRSSDGVDVFAHKQQNKNSGFGLGYDVLRDMYTMASCCGLICGNSQVAYAAQIEKIKGEKTYEYLRIIDKGCYKKIDLKAEEKYKRREGLDNRLDNMK